MNLSTNRLSIINFDQEPAGPEAGRDVIHLAGCSASQATSGDLAIDPQPDKFQDGSQFHKILEEACVATGATGAAIALRRGEEFVCCAASGPSAPSLGSCLDPHAGLSGCCIQTRELQRCSDTETDARVNLEACRRLEVRSIVVQPLCDSDELFGVFELLWSQADAFERLNLHIFELLARQIIQYAKARPIANASAPHKELATGEVQTELLAREIATSTPWRDARLRRRHHWTAIQTAAVIALSVLLGWLMGRAGGIWRSVERRATLTNLRNRYRPSRKRPRIHLTALKEQLQCHPLKTKRTSPKPHRYRKVTLPRNLLRSQTPLRAT